MIRDELSAHEEELYALVSEQVLPWGDKPGVVGAGLGTHPNADASDHDYCVCVYLQDESADIRDLPASLTVRLRNGQSVTLPVRLEVTGIPHGQCATRR